MDDDEDDEEKALAIAREKAPVTFPVRGIVVSGVEASDAGRIQPEDVDWRVWNVEECTDWPAEARS